MFAKAEGIAPVRLLLFSRLISIEIPLLDLYQQETVKATILLTGIGGLSGGIEYWEVDQ
jgi:hypothetical protein